MEACLWWRRGPPGGSCVQRKDTFPMFTAPEGADCWPGVDVVDCLVAGCIDIHNTPSFPVTGSPQTCKATRCLHCHRGSPPAMAEESGQPRLVHPGLFLHEGPVSPPDLATTPGANFQKSWQTVFLGNSARYSISVCLSNQHHNTTKQEF